MATKQKVAPAAKGKKAAAVEAPQIVVGSNLKFLGYGDDVPDEDRILTEGETYPLVEIAADDAGNPLYVVTLANPDFNAKKKEHAETNPKNIEAELFPNEVELVTDDAAAEEEAEPVAEVAPAKGKAKAAVKEAAAPAKAAAGKGKAVAAPAKGKAAVKAAEPKAEVAEDDDLPDLENEDADVAAIVNESEDLIATAQDLEAQVGTTEYQLGGVLYHIRKNKSYKDLDDGAYADKGGFRDFLAAYLNIDYRKAMYLVEIYVHFNLAGITDASARVAAIGWTKASKIAKLMTEEGANPDELLALAESSTVADLQSSISVQKTEVGGTKGEIKKRITLKFGFFEDEGQGIADVIEAAKEKHGLKSLEEAFAMIVREWAAENAGEAAPVAVAPKQATPVGSAKAKATAKPVAAKRTAKA